MHSILLLKYIRWHFFIASVNLAKGWGNMLWFCNNYFSLGLLLRTYIAPWRRISWEYGRGFNIGRYLYVFSSNLISRILGAIMRTVLITIGITLELLVAFAALVSLILWITLPVLIVFSFLYGLRLLF